MFVDKLEGITFTNNVECVKEDPSLPKRIWEYMSEFGVQFILCALPEINLLFKKKGMLCSCLVIDLSPGIGNAATHHKFSSRQKMSLGLKSRVGSFY